MPYDDPDDIASLMPSLSPIMSAGLDPDAVLASGDPQGMLAAARAGVPYQSQAQKEAQSSQLSSQLAAAAAPKDGARNMSPRAEAELAAQTQQAENAPSQAQDTGTSGTFSPGVRTRLAPRPPSTNAPNPPSEQGAAPAIPASVTSTGTATPATFQNLADMQKGAAEKAQGLNQSLMDAPTADAGVAPLSSKLAQLKSPQGATNPDGTPNPKDPQYKPSGIRRIARGALGAVEGLARGGIRGAVLGAVDPAALGATPYGAPNSKFSQAAQRNAQLQEATQGQIGDKEKTFDLDTKRTAQEISSIKDIGAMAGDASKTLGANQKADYENQLADTKAQVAKAIQENADTKADLAAMKMPTTYEATVVAGALETDPAKKAAYQTAAKQMAATELKRFQYKAAADGGGTSPFRQSLIDNATQQVQDLQDNYRYNPRRNTYSDDKGNELTPQQFTDKKNQIATKLDQQLTAKKLKPLGVRFDPADAGANKPARVPGQPSAQQPQAKPQSGAVMPPASLLSKTPEGGSVVGQGGETFVKRGGQWAPQ